MAIVKTTFTGQSLAAQAPELLAYLQENAADFFDSITADASGNISCYIGETVALLIGMDGSSQRKVTLKNGDNVQIGYSDMLSRLWSYAKKTANGILLVSANATIVFFVTKNELGDTCIMGYLPTLNAVSNNLSYFFADIKNDSTIFKPVANVSRSGFSALSKSAAVTALTPVIFIGGHYAPKAYIATFNQFSLTECDVNINGKSYVSDGVCMLSD